MSPRSRGPFALVALLCLVLAGCGDATDNSTTAASTATGSSTVAEKPAPTAAADRKDARQNIGRIADGLKGLNHYVADFDEIAPVRASEGDAVGAKEDAQTVIAALGLLEGDLVFDSPAAADREQAAYKAAIRKAKQSLEQVGVGDDLPGQVDKAKKALAAITPAANDVTNKLQSIAAR